MTVSQLTRPSACLLLLVLSALPSLAVAGALIRCKTSILNRYKLGGLEFAVTSQMKVCPSVIDRCCSVTDEVTISKLWNDKTLPLLNGMTDKIMKNIWLSIQYYKNITLIDPGLIMVKHLIKRRIPYQRRACRTIRRRITWEDTRDIQDYFQVADRGEELDLGSPDFVNTFQSSHVDDLFWNTRSAGQVNTTVENPRFEPQPSGADEAYDLARFERANRHLDQLDTGVEASGPKLFPSDLGQQEDLSRFVSEETAGKGAPERKLAEARERIQNEVKNSDAGQLPNLQNPAGVPDFYDMYRFTDPPARVQRPEVVRPTAAPEEVRPGVPQAVRAPVVTLASIGGGRPHPEVPNPASYSDIYQVASKSQPNQPPQSPFKMTAGWKDPLQSESDELDELNPDEREEMERRGTSFGDWFDDEVYRWDDLQWRKSQTNDRNKLEKRAFRMTRYQIEDDFLPMDDVACRPVRGSFVKDFIIINEEKVDFCFGLYRRFLNFDIELFEGFLPKVKESIAKLSEHKKSFYCALCDAHKQAHFSISNQMVYYDVNYCRSTLATFRDYFRFMNLIYVDFIDSILQYINCFESDGLVFEFPFQNYLGRMKQRYPFWRKCLDSLDSEFFINSCWSICNKLNINARSSLIEGNLEFMERSTATIFSFLRKFKIESAREGNASRNFNDTFSAGFTLNLRTGKNVDGLLTEPLGPHSLVTDNKFVVEKISSGLLTKQTTPWSNLTDKDAMQAAIDEMLTDLQLGTVQDLIDYSHKVVGFKRMELPLDERFVDNADRKVSRVNGLVNQLYKLRTIQQLSPTEIPSRFLKQEAFKIIKKFGMRPKEYVRTLKLFTPPGARKLILQRPLWREDRVVAKNMTTIQSYGTPINHVGLPTFPPLEKMDPTIVLAEVESNVEVYNKILNGTDVRNMGILYEKEGLNPLQDFEMANYGFNITKLIGLQFTKAEKIDSDVIRQFMICNAADVNRFNENSLGHTMDLASLEGKYVGMKKASQLETLAKILAPDKNVSLALQVQMRFRSKMSEMMKAHSKNVALEALEARMEQMYKLHAQIKEKEKNSQTVNHHWFMGFDEVFNGIADLFISLFGA